MATFFSGGFRRGPHELHRIAGDWAGKVQKAAYEAYLQVEDSRKSLYKPAAHSGSFEKIVAKEKAE